MNNQADNRVSPSSADREDEDVDRTDHPIDPLTEEEMEGFSDDLLRGDGDPQFCLSLEDGWPFMGCQALSPFLLEGCGSKMSYAGTLDPIPPLGTANPMRQFSDSAVYPGGPLIVRMMHTSCADGIVGQKRKVEELADGPGPSASEDASDYEVTADMPSTEPGPISAPVTPPATVAVRQELQRFGLNLTSADEIRVWAQRLSTDYFTIFLEQKGSCKKNNICRFMIRWTYAGREVLRAANENLSAILEVELKSGRRAPKRYLRQIRFPVAGDSELNLTEKAEERNENYGYVQSFSQFLAAFMVAPLEEQWGSLRSIAPVIEDHQRVEVNRGMTGSRLADGSRVRSFSIMIYLFEHGAVLPVARREEGGSDEGCLDSADGGDSDIDANEFTEGSEGGGGCCGTDGGCTGNPEWPPGREGDGESYGVRPICERSLDSDISDAEAGSDRAESSSDDEEDTARLVASMRLDIARVLAPMKYTIARNARQEMQTIFNLIGDYFSTHPTATEVEISDFRQVLTRRYAIICLIFLVISDPIILLCRLHVSKCAVAATYRNVITLRPTLAQHLKWLTKCAHEKWACAYSEHMRNAATSINFDWKNCTSTKSAVVLSSSSLLLGARSSSRTQLSCGVGHSSTEPNKTAISVLPEFSSLTSEDITCDDEGLSSFRLWCAVKEPHSSPGASGVDEALPIAVSVPAASVAALPIQDDLSIEMSIAPVSFNDQKGSWGTLSEYGTGEHSQCGPGASGAHEELPPCTPSLEASYPVDHDDALDILTPSVFFKVEKRSTSNGNDCAIILSWKPDGLAALRSNYVMEYLLRKELFSASSTESRTVFTTISFDERWNATERTELQLQHCQQFFFFLDSFLRRPNAEIARDLLTYQSEMFQHATRLIETGTVQNGLSFAVLHGVFKRHHCTGASAATMGADEWTNISTTDDIHRQNHHIYHDLYLLGDKLHTEDCASEDVLSDLV